MTNFKYSVLVLALVSTSTWAQRQTRAERDEDNLATFQPCHSCKSDFEIIVTANGITQRRDEAGQAISVIDEQMLATRQTSVISDILRSVPGVSIARNGGVGSATSVFIRGGDSSQTLVLIDGVRINDPSSPNAAFDFGALLTGNIGRIEVLRGPNSVIWGSQAIGGVVNIQTLEPTEPFTLKARGEYGYQDSVNLQANVAGSTGNVSGSIGGGLFRTTGISALAGGSERDGYRNASANGKLKINFTKDIALDFRGYYNRGEVQFDSGFPPSPNSLPETDNEQFLGYVGLRVALFDGRLTNRIAYSRTDISRNGSDAERPLNFNVNAIKATLDRFEYHGAFDVSDAAKLVFGVEHERSFARIFFPANGPGAVPDRARTSVTSAFGQLLFKPLDGLTLTGGARYDGYRDYGGQTTFGANFAYSPNDGRTLIRGTYAEGFRAPTLTEALLPFGNAALKPETAKSFDLGVEQSLANGTIRASATYFRRDSRNLITFSFDTFQSENIAKARGEGIEFGLALRPTETLDFAANYSFIDATSRSPGSLGNRLARRPKQTLNLSGDWQSPLGVSIGTTVTLTSDTFDDLGNGVGLDGYALIGLRAAYRVNDRVELFGRIENLGDENYQTASGFNSLGRNAYVGARVTF